MGGKLPTQTYHKLKVKTADFEKLRSRLKVRHLDAKLKLAKKHPHLNKFFTEKGLELDKIREHSAKILGAGTLVSALLLNPPNQTLVLPPPHEVIEKLKVKGISIESKGEVSKEKIKATPEALVDILKSSIPEKPRPLDRNEEKFLEQIFQNILGVSARANLEGEHLNTTYGYIGAEQHLRRFPGDTLREHGEGTILKEGMAPGLGAWGYFAKSRENLTEDLVEIEKWYAVVQTLYLPDWYKRQPHLKNWYKYRKVLIVNTQNGQAVVAAIADSGPAAWTGKQFGGSPEVMNHLGGSRYKKGAVIIFFVDDPENEVPLGPVEYN